MIGHWGAALDLQQYASARAFSRALEALSHHQAAAVAGSSCASILEGRPGSGTSYVLSRLAGDARPGPAPRTVLRFCCTAEIANEDFAATRGLLASAGRDLPPGGTPRATVTGLLAEGPVTVLLDDAQWCDVATLRLFASLLRDGPHLPLCLVLARVAAPRTGSDAALAEIASLARTQVLALGKEDDKGDKGTDARRPLDLAERIDGGRAVVTAAAVLGGAERALVAGVSGLPEIVVAAVLDLLRPAGAFWAEPIRARVLESVDEDELTRLRVRAARLLDDAARPVTEVAELLVAVPSPLEPWMRAALAEAAAVASERARFGDAVRFLRPALDGTPAGHPGRFPLAGALLPVSPAAATAEFAALAMRSETPDGTRAAVALFAASVATAPDDGPEARDVPDDTHRTRALLARLREHQVDEAGSRSLAIAALAGLAASRKGAARALGTIAAVPSTVSSPLAEHANPVVPTVAAVRQLALSGRGLDVVRGTARGVLRHDRALSAGLLLGLGGLLHLADDVPGGIRALDAAVARTVLDPENGPENGIDDLAVARALAVRSLVLRENGELACATKDVKASVVVAGEKISAPESGMVRVALAAALYFDDQLAAAERVLRSGAVAYGDEMSWEAPLRLLWLGRISARRGDTKAALDLLAESGRCQAEAGIANPVVAPWWFQSALTLVEAGRPVKAREYVELGRALVERWPTTRARGFVLLADGATSLRDDAVDVLREACGVLATSPSRLEQARAELFLGKELLLRGDRKGARRHLRSAASLGENAGWRRLAVDAREALGSAGGRMTKVSRRSAFALTERERAVAGLVARGASNREVAKQLFVSARTVELDLTNVYRKLAIGGRADLAAVLDVDEEHRDLAG